MGKMGTIEGSPIGDKAAQKRASPDDGAEEWKKKEEGLVRLIGRSEKERKKK